ncbi:hypothetical protein MMC28_000731 [Mycoblastus sanguinarius]|nr:hypothetical protein [Mycoblastus sanguinarius]
MTLRQELSSWLSPSSLLLSPTPSIGSKAPPAPKLQLPDTNGKPTILTFLRHCGCPFAEKTFLSLRAIASAHPSINYIAISHSSHASTKKWLEAIGGPGSVEVIVDEERIIFAHWGLGTSGWGHVLSPGGLWSVYKLGKEEGIWNRPTESGSRWQTAGSWAVDERGVVRWGAVAGRADEIPDFAEGMRALEEAEWNSEGR